MPVSTALDLLKDKEGIIVLEVPVKGDLNNPDVNINQVIRLATTQALKKGSMTYLKFALQPYGAILMAAEAIGDMSSAVSLQPMEFVPGTDQVVPAQADYVSKIATLLKERPNLTIKLCPVITYYDTAEYKAAYEAAKAKSQQAEPVIEEPEQGTPRVLAQAEQKLAKARIASIKRSLIEQEQVSSRQLMSCRARWGQGVPRVLLEM